MKVGFYFFGVCFFFVCEKPKKIQTQTEKSGICTYIKKNGKKKKIKGPQSADIYGNEDRDDNDEEEEEEEEEQQEDEYREVRSSDEETDAKTVLFVDLGVLFGV